MAKKALPRRPGIMRRIGIILLALLFDIVGMDVVVMVGVDGMAIVGEGDEGAVGGGQGVSNGRTSVTCKMGVAMPSVSSRCPTTVAAKPLLWFPVVLHVSQSPSIRPMAITSSFPALSRMTSGTYKEAFASDLTKIWYPDATQSGISRRQWNECSSGLSKVTKLGLSIKNPKSMQKVLYMGEDVCVSANDVRINNSNTAYSKLTP